MQWIDLEWLFEILITLNNINFIMIILWEYKSGISEVHSNFIFKFKVVLFV